MADLSPGAQRLLAFLPDIQSAVGEHATTQQFWQAIQDAAASSGFDISGVNAIDAGQLRSFAVANRNAMEAFNRAATDASLNAGFIGSELYQQPGNVPDSQRLFMVRFAHTVIEDGVELDVWRTDQIRGYLPPTKDQLMSLLDSDAQLLADEYNQTHVGIGSVSISAA